MIQRIRPFSFVADRSQLPTAWQKWKRELQRYFDASGVISQWEKRSQMLHLAGSEVQEVFDHLPGVDDFPLVLADPPYYDVAIQRLDEHFEPMRRRNYERHLFRQIVQNSNERFADFILRLRIQAKRCEFDRYDARECNDRIIEQIVEGCKSSELRRQILVKDMVLDDIVALGSTLADVQQQVKELDRNPVAFEPNLNKVSTRMTTHFAPRNDRFDQGFRRSAQGSARGTVGSCFACGLKGHWKGDDNCRARNAKCVKCKGTGHFANRCLKRQSNSQVSYKAKRVRLIEEDKLDQPMEEIFYAMGNNTFEFVVGGVKVPMIIDSGADANVITEDTWAQANRDGLEVLEYSQSVDRRLIAYASTKPMEICGMFRAIICAGQNQVDAKIYIVKQGQRNLLGDKTAKQLEVLKVGFDIASISSSESTCFPKMKGIVVEIPINESIQPVQQGYRRAPIALEGKIHDKLKSLLDKDIIEKVSGPSAWVSPMVPVLKGSGEVRICVDMRRANQ